MAELHLVHEHREKLYEEKEEQRELRERMRDEQKAENEIEKARRGAEEEEQRHAKALEKARAQLDRATGAQVEKLEGLVEKLEQELATAMTGRPRALHAHSSRGPGTCMSCRTSVPSARESTRSG